MSTENGLNARYDVRLSLDLIAEILFVMFYAMPFFKWAIENVFELIGLESAADACLLVLMYLTVYLLCVFNKKYVVWDFIILYLGIILFFLLTYRAHPEYEYVYTRDYYGVIPYVLRPDNGLYAYLFIRLVNKPERLDKGLKISAYLMMIYSFITLIFSLKRGFWYAENYLGETFEASYDLNFGYNLLLPICVFILAGLRNKNLKDLAIAAFGVIMVFIGGARGPLLGICIFCFLYVLMAAADSKHKVGYVVLVAAIGGLAIAYYRAALTFIAAVLDSVGISSRTINKFLEGSISEDNGRSELWNAAIEHIRKNPHGSGAMGARNALYEIHNVGHPHNVFLEILIDYGIYLGTALIVLMIIISITVLFSKKYAKWKWVYLLFLAQACSLLTSYTYWHSNGVWGLLAVSVCAIIDCRNDKYKVRVVV